MARGINKVILIGNLGAEPEVRYTPGGSAIANTTLATSTSWKDKQTGEMQDRVEWHRVVFFNRLAEIVGEYLHKGSKIYVEGALRTRKWQDKAGVERYTTEIIANEMQMLDSRAGGNFDPDSQGNSQSNSQPNHGNFSHESSIGNGNIQSADSFVNDDDIPF